MKFRRLILLSLTIVVVTFLIPKFRQKILPNVVHLDSNKYGAAINDKYPYIPEYFNSENELRLFFNDMCLTYDVEHLRTWYLKPLYVAVLYRRFTLSERWSTLLVYSLDGRGALVMKDAQLITSLEATVTVFKDGTYDVEPASD